MNARFTRLVQKQTWIIHSLFFVCFCFCCCFVFMNVINISGRSGHRKSNTHTHTHARTQQLPGREDNERIPWSLCLMGVPTPVLIHTEREILPVYRFHSMLKVALWKGIALFAPRSMGSIQLQLPWYWWCYYFWGVHWWNWLYSPINCVSAHVETQEHLPPPQIPVKVW